MPAGLGPDPGAPQVGTPDGRTAQNVAALQRAVEALQRTAAGLVTVGAGAPPADAQTPFYIDGTNHRLYVRDAAGYFPAN